MSTENKVVFKKGPLYRKASETNPGILFFATDAGRLFLNTAQGQSIEIHSDLPYGVLGSENNNITVDKPVVLGDGVSINVYGSRIPVQLNINNTGARNVKLNGATLSAAQVLEGNTIITYTYVQSENAWIAGSVPGNSSSGDSAKKYKFGLTFSNETKLGEGTRLYTLNSLNGYLTNSLDYAAELLSLYTDISTDPTSVSISINGVPSYVQAMGGGAYALISNLLTGELPFYLVSVLVSYEDGSGNTVAVISAQYLIGQEVPSNTILSIDAYTSVISNAIIKNYSNINTAYVGGISISDKYDDFNTVVIGFLRDGIAFSKDRVCIDVSGSTFSVSDLAVYTATIGAVDYERRTLIFSGSVYGRRCDIAFEIHPESEREDYIKKGYYVITSYDEEEDVEGTLTRVTYHLMYSVVTRNRIYELTVDSSPATSNNKTSYQFMALDGCASNTKSLDRLIFDIQKALSPEKYGVALNALYVSDGHLVYDKQDTKSKSDICINAINSNGEKVCLYPRYYDNTKCIFCSDVVDTTTGAPVQDPTLQMYNGLVFTLTVTYPTNYGTQQDTHAVVSNLELLELLGQGRKVTANPTLVGGESNLTSLQIGSTKYAIPSGGGGVSQIQSDWDQSNSSSVDYIKNRPFYEEDVSITVDPSSYEYSGVIELSISKISDQVLTLDQLKGASGTYYVDGTTYTFSSDDDSLIYEEIDLGVVVVMAKGVDIPLLISGNDFSDVASGIDGGTYAIAIESGGDFYSRLVTLSYTAIKTIDNKFIDLSTVNRLAYTITSASYKNYSYNFRDDKVRYLENFAFVESECTDIVIPRVESIGNFAFLASSLGRNPGRLLDFSYCHFLNHIGSAIACINFTSDGSGKYNYYNGLTGIAIWGNEKRDYSQLTISQYALNGIYHGVLVLNSPYDSAHSAFLSTMNAQGIYVAFSNNTDAGISEMNTVVNGLTDISTISDSWDTIISNINSGNYSQYLLGTKKIYFDITDSMDKSHYTRQVAYLQCVGTDKDVDSSDDTIKTTWVFKDIEFIQRMMESGSGCSWANSYLRSFLADSTKFRMYYLDSNDQEVDFSNIAVPAKKTYLDNYSYDKYWIPSVRELNASDLALAESSGCIYDQYYTDEKMNLYNCNSSRIRWGRSYRYPESQVTTMLWWTRTGDSDNNSFLYVSERGEIYDENDGNLYSDTSVGTIVGMCI